MTSQSSDPKSSTSPSADTQNRMEDSNPVIEKKWDLLISGCGPAGLSLAGLLAPSGLKIALIDRQPLASIADPAFDGRDIALTHGSRKILTQMNVWNRIDESLIHPLVDATVQDGASPYALHFQAEDNQQGPLGFLIANHTIRRALYEEVSQHPNVTIIPESNVNNILSDHQSMTVVLDSGVELSAPLVVAADSRFSEARRMRGIGAKMKDYGRVMIVCNMRHQLDHGNRAQECFHYGRTCAILPLSGGQASIVITVPSSQSEHLTGLTDEQFSREAEEMLGGRLGAMELISERHAYPLVGAYSDRFVGHRFALIGDAAVGMHPVTAHGYNLGLQSAQHLGKLIAGAHRSGKDIGSQWLLHRYELQHQVAAKPLYESTNLIVRLYTNDNPAARLARKAALRVGNNLAPFKRLVAQRLTQLG